MFNAVTIAREYGSGGAEVGRRVAERLGWESVDREIIERVAAMGKVDRNWAEEADERCSAWWERVLKGFRHGGPEGYLGGFADSGVDRDSLQKFTARVIEEAANMGQCVIIGRGSQCVLRNYRNVLHVLVYAPMSEKLIRMRPHHPGEQNLEAVLHRIDSERHHYIQDYYGCDSTDRGLYHLCVNSALGLDTCAGLIMNAIRFSEMRQKPEREEASI
jgi:cytidylate kinase